MHRCAVLALLLAPLTAHAGGFFYPDSGIRAFGRGGAWIAGADSQFAQRYNPAGLIRVDRPTINIGLSGVQQDIRADLVDQEGNVQPTVENQGKPFLIPQIGFATPLGDQFALAVGFYSPFAPDYRFAEDGAQRYTSIDSSIWQFSVGPSLAWQPIHWFTLGAGVQWQYLNVVQELNVIAHPVGAADTSGNSDVRVAMSAKDPFTLNANVGILIEPVEPLSIGLSLQPPTKFRGRGEGRLDFTDWSLANLLDQTVYTDDAVTLNISLPMTLAAGVAVRPVPALEIEVASVWERWSSMKDILVEDIDVTITGGPLIGEQPVADTIALPAGYRDVVSVRLGAEYAITPDYAVRLGGFYETGALSNEQLSVALYDPQKYQLSLGGSALIADHLGIDLAAAWLFFPDKHITNSEVTAINVFGDAEATVGNGDFHSSGWMVGGQLSYAFGARPE